MRHWNNGTDHRHSKSCCDKSSPARRTIIKVTPSKVYAVKATQNYCSLLSFKGGIIYFTFHGIVAANGSSDSGNEAFVAKHHSDVIMCTMASQNTSLTIVCTTVYSGADQRKHQSSASLAFVRGSRRGRGIPRTKASNAENVSIWWRHHDLVNIPLPVFKLSSARVNHNTEFYIVGLNTKIPFHHQIIKRT